MCFAAIFEDPEVEPSLPTILPEPEEPIATILPEPTQIEEEPLDCKTLSNLTYNELAAMHVWPAVARAGEAYATILSGTLLAGKFLITAVSCHLPNPS
jgi:hypothetical protein